ncbi:EAL domain-containing protein [Thiorhodococcus mannitoliphagus]|uniref:cyclic-guanylate-specific phosphodiesterase n=1 Tax=Thiorhodococcus mannitoliphagus TaxID=329406 RepID=A0A6P1DZA3_9GAMM|nr:EAL domain-containing protein [Thiorhodococcus mannitoliphagus]NEX22351.1 EAL domain-containing protein [Thiorhodococcus mannitoliphagus]
MPQALSHSSEQLKATLIDEAFRQGRAGIPMTTVAILGISGIHWLHAHTLIQPLWLLIGLSVSLLRGALLYTYQRHKDRLDTKTRERMFVWPLIAAALVWVALPILVFPSAEASERLAIVAIVAGLAGGGSAILAPMLWSARFYILCLMAPATVMVFDTPTSGPIVAILAASFMLMVLFSHQQGRRILLASQERLLENQSLLSETHRQRGLVEQLNAELMDAQKALLAYNLRLEQEVEERTARNRLASAVIENTAEGVMVMTPDAIIVEVNPAFTRITGYAAPEAIGQPASILRSDKHEARFFALGWQQLRTLGRWEGEMWSRQRNGKIFLERRTIDAVRDTEGEVTHYVCVFNDITDDYEKDQQLLHQALHDPLTGLGNRKLLLERLEHGIAHASRQGKRLGVLFFDLDQFKAVNDSLGHHIGDELLRGIGQRLSKRLRASDTLARLGGDEFVVLMSDLENPADAVVLAQGLLDVFSKPFELPETRIHMRTSLGIAIYPDDGEDPDALMKNADMALYAAKEAGRNTYHFFQPAFAEQAQQRLDLELALRDAIEQQELSLYYQPKVCAKDQSPQGFEALLRWNRPGLGFVPPDRFVPIAEDCGLIGQIGAWALAEACRQIACWEAAGYGSQQVAINVSVRQLIHDDLAGMIREECERHRISPSLLEVEVTESCVMSNPEQTTPVLEALKRMQVRIAIDDFGTGHSSLAYLRRLPVDIIKIDKSFVQEAMSDKATAAIVKTIIELSKTLEMQVVAEGVETAEQAAMLADNGCDSLQGYFFSRPLPPEDIARQWHAGPALSAARS